MLTPNMAPPQARAPVQQGTVSSPTGELSPGSPMFQAVPEGAKCSDTGTNPLGYSRDFTHAKWMLATPFKGRRWHPAPSAKVCELRQQTA